MHHTDEVIALIDGHLAQARQELARLEAARDAMQARPSASSTAAKRGRRGPASSGRRPGAARVNRRPVSVARLERLLAGSHGAGTTDLAGQAHADRAHVLALLRQMEAQGQVRRTGERRGTRWHLVTDEERAAARAAELARQSRRRR